MGRGFFKEAKKMDTGHLIALHITLLYAILGPLVLFAIYALFDSLSKPGETDANRPDTVTDMKDPALWTDEEINAHLNRI